jgi:signal transduction histidine kinase
MTQPAPFPEDEAGRLVALRRYKVLDTEPEQGFDDVTMIASQICDTPIALVSFVDEARQWFKSRVGLDAKETPRDLAFCAHAILQPGLVLQIPDPSRDERFKANPLVTGQPNIGFYAGAPLVTTDGHALGTICVVDDKPRHLSDQQIAALQALARQVMAELELRCSRAELARSNHDLENFAYLASHDLRAPLRGIDQLAGFIEEDAAEVLPESSRNHLAQLRSRCMKLEIMLDNVLAYSQLERKESKPRWVDTRAMISDTADLVVPADKFSVEIPPDLPPLHAPVPAVELVFRNILSNAVKHHDLDRGAIRIEWFRDSQHIHVTVADDGPGIAAEHQDKVFQLFATLKKNGQAGSSGMGLAFVKKTLENCGGSVAVVAGSERGTKIRTSWPAATRP